VPRVDLAVPFGEDQEARRLGARWDRERKVWFVPEGVDRSQFHRWLPKTIDVRSTTYYIAQGPEICWKCSQPIQVFAFILPAGYEVLMIDEDSEAGEEDEEDCWETMEDVGMLSYIEYLSPTVESRIRALAPHYRRAHSKAARMWYWMNHCPGCGAPQGDHYLFREPQGGFLPTEFGAARTIRLHRIDQPLRAAAAYGEAESFAYLWRT
jgi:hypothetical protein